MEFDGLTEKEASKRLVLEGYNEIEKSKKSNFFKIIFKVFKEPMFFLLIACGIIYLFLGDIHEATILLLGVVFIIAITVHQENKTEKTLDALREVSSPRTIVMRDGEKKRIAGREVVRGDILVLAEGDRVPADAIILSCSNMKVDESLLTGESVPVRKSSSRTISKIGAPGGEDLPFIYSGTLIISGNCIAEVVKIGMNTEMGKIGKSLKAVKPEKTQLKKEVDKIVKYFAIWGLFLCIIVIVLYGTLRGVWLKGILAGLTLAISVLPEEFPVVLTVFLALGAWRMSKKRVLTRKPQAIQALGSTTVLCVDKTGTLTMNQMTVKKIYSKFKLINLLKEKLNKNFYGIIKVAMLASQKDSFDPMDKAIKTLANKINFTKYENSFKLIKEFPMTNKIIAMSNVWKSEKGIILATKGAPESIFSLCKLDSKKKEKLLKEVEKMASEGLRVLGVAKASVRSFSEKDKLENFNFEFTGLLGFEDPIRPKVASAINECYNAGIKVIMLTGDYPITAKNIGLQIGLKDGEIISGPELDVMKDSELKRRISGVSIFARIVPEQKLRIIAALKANGENVAMTGDGVNDAPALKSAHVGIAMGMRGTDVAREASGIVILDDDFSSIVAGLRSGRRIFDNLRKAMGYIFAVHFPIAGITILALLAGWPLLLFPAHIVFLELVIDPACSIVFEAGKEEKNIMKRKPRDPKEKIFDRKTVLQSVINGIFMLAVVALVFKLALLLAKSEEVSRSVAFSVLILTNLALIISNLHWKKSIFSFVGKKNKALIYVVVGALLFLVLTIYVPYLRETFLLGALTLKDWAVVLGAVAVTVFGFEFIKKRIKRD